MLRTLSALAALMLLSPVVEAGAGDLIPRLGIFRKKKDDPAASDKDKAAKVKQLVDTLKNDTDPKKREAAAEDLRDYDPRAHLDLVPTLVAALKADPSPDVRAEAASSIGAIKLIQPTAGVALEQTYAQDPSETVRKAAQAALWQYHVNGYRSAGANPAQPQTAEPPLAKPRDVTAKTVPATPISTPGKTTPVPVNTVSKPKGGVYQQTIEPPLAKSKTTVPPLTETVTPPLPSLNVPSLPVVPTVPSVPQVPSQGVPPPQ